MRRISVAAIATTLGLAGCPLPQPLPDYPAGTITPPRILVDEIDGNAEPVRFVPAGCATEPVFPLTATLYDTNNIETVEARWFVNYAHDQAYWRTYKDDAIPPDPDPLVLTRVVPPDSPAGEPQPFQFGVYHAPPPYGTTPQLPGPPWSDAGIVRVVELVVSNGFDPAAVDNPASPTPNRATLAGFETQVYRWVFLTVAPSASCAPGQPGCVTCPP